MIGNIKRDKYPRYSSHQNTIPDWMGYRGSDYSRYDPRHDERIYGDSRGIDHLEGAGLEGWDEEQNHGYGLVHDNRRGPVTFPMREGHRGKGPRNYRRSDQRILEDIIERLSDEVSDDLSELEIDVREGEVFLKGTACDRYTRHTVEDVVGEVSGVRHIENAIRIEHRN